MLNSTLLDDFSYVTKVQAGSGRDQAETSVLFELIAANQPVGQWDKIFPNPAMTVAAIDRLVHRAAIFELHVESYRRRTAIDRHASGSAQRLPRSRPPTTPLQFLLPVGQLPATLPSSPGDPVGTPDPPVTRVSL